MEDDDTGCCMYYAWTCLMFGHRRKNKCPAWPDENPLLLDKDHECAICLDTRIESPQRRWVRTRCGHLFHGKCLRQWWKQRSDKSDSCPLCLTSFE